MSECSPHNRQKQDTLEGSNIELWARPNLKIKSIPMEVLGGTGGLVGDLWPEEEARPKIGATVSVKIEYDEDVVPDNHF